MLCYNGNAINVLMLTVLKDLHNESEIQLRCPSIFCFFGFRKCKFHDSVVRGWLVDMASPCMVSIHSSGCSVWNPPLSQPPGEVPAQHLVNCRPFTCRWFCNVECRFLLKIPNIQWRWTYRAFLQYVCTSPTLFLWWRTETERLPV